MKKIPSVALALIITSCMCAFITGCGSVGETPLDRSAATTKLEPQDVRRTVEAMVESLLSETGIAEYSEEQRPVLDIEPMKNQTSQHINMTSITDSIRTQLLRSRKFRFMDKSTSGTDVEFMDTQANAGLTDPNKAIRAGQQSAAQMYLTGTLTEIRNKEGRTTDQYYKFSMILKDLKTGEIVWADEKEIRKEKTRPVFGL